MKTSLMTLAVVLAIAGAVFADIPHMISYQGRVTDDIGVPVADGTYDMRFRIYDGETGGTLEWDSGTQSVDVEGGVFNVYLGESPQPTLDLPFDEDYWLLVTFDGVNQTPRHRFASVGYAYMASGLVPGTLIEGSVTSGTSSAVKAVNTASSGTRYGVYALTSSASGRAVAGHATADSGTTYGGKFQTDSPSGRGCYGWATATTGTTYGGAFKSSSPDGYGVWGKAEATAGPNYGVYGETSSTAGKGVHGTATAGTGSTYGVQGVSNSTHGAGVEGFATAGTGYTWGVVGRSSSTDGKGVYGYTSAGTGVTHGVYGETASTDGRGVYGEATATTDCLTYGGRFVANSIAGRGVRGEATASTGTTYGGMFDNSSTGGTGVKGWALATTGQTYGVHGQSDSDEGAGVHGEATATSGDTYGVYGQSDSDDGRGVHGTATATTGATRGVSGWSYSTDGVGVLGYARAETGYTTGGLFVNDSGDGWAVHARANGLGSATLGVFGESYSTGDGSSGVAGGAWGSDGRTYGVRGTSYSPQGIGVDGHASAGTGDTYGVRGRSASESGTGVYGEATATTGSTSGGFFTSDSPSGTGVQGEGDYRGGRFKDTDSNNYCYAGYSTYKTWGTGTNAFVQNHPSDNDRVIVYAAPEGDEVATYTRGTARLVDGEARVPLGETFKWVTNPDIGLTAHLTPRGKGTVLFVESLTTDQMVVRAMEGFPDDVAFDYVVYGLRIGFEEASIVQQKQEESYIPSMEDHRDLYAKHPGLRRYNALERFKTMRTAAGNSDPLNLSASQALRGAVGEYDPAIHGAVESQLERARRARWEAEELVRPESTRRRPNRVREALTGRKLRQSEEERMEMIQPLDANERAGRDPHVGGAIDPARGGEHR